MIQKKWAPVFRKDHAQIKRWSGMTIRRKVIPLYLCRTTDPAVLFNIHHRTRIELAASAMLCAARDRQDHAS
jgi:hypothetical protein